MFTILELCPATMRLHGGQDSGAQAAHAPYPPRAHVCSSLCRACWGLHICRVDRMEREWLVGPSSTFYCADHSSEPEVVYHLQNHSLWYRELKNSLSSFWSLTRWPLPGDCEQIAPPLTVLHFSRRYLRSPGIYWWKCHGNGLVSSSQGSVPSALGRPPVGVCLLSGLCAHSGHITCMLRVCWGWAQSLLSVSSQ